MKFKIKVTNGNAEWLESYSASDVADLDQARAWANVLLSRFNIEEQRRYGEEARLRTLVSVEMEGEGSVNHEWEKQNSFTIMGDGHAARDRYRCTVCGCEGLRYGLSETIKRTGKWRAQKYKHCQPPQG